MDGQEIRISWARKKIPCPRNPDFMGMEFPLGRHVFGAVLIRLIMRCMQNRRLRGFSGGLLVYFQLSIPSNDAAAVAACSGIHECTIEPVLEDLAGRQGEKPALITAGSYCNAHRRMRMKYNGHNRG